MGLFKKLSSIFSQPKRGSRDAFWVQVRCRRCGETVRGRINLNNDLSAEYDGETTTYVCRKLLMGEARCFQQIEVVLKFDESRNLVDQSVMGGELVSAGDLPASPGY